MIRVATRASALARWQAERVGARLGRVEYVLVSTTGDRDQTSDLHAIGGLGVFTKEVQQAVLDGTADIAVHSAKDLPTATPPGLVLATIPERADPRDALVGCSFARTPHRRARSARAPCGAAPSSPRRVPTSRSGRCAATSRPVCASAWSSATTRLSSRSPPSSGSAWPTRSTTCSAPKCCCRRSRQGALAVECRADDDRTLARLHAIDDPVAHMAVDAERAFLAELGGGCDLPCGALARASTTAARSCSRDCSRRSTVTSCCGRRSPARSRSTSEPPRRVISSTAKVAARSSRTSHDRVPRRRRTG